MYQNKSTIIATANGGDNLYSNYYWSSTENNSTTAWQIYFGSGGIKATQNKYSYATVRAIRAF